MPGKKKLENLVSNREKIENFVSKSVPVVGAAFYLGVFVLGATYVINMKSNETNTAKADPKVTERISGKIVDIDEDSFGCFSKGWDAGVQFEYETLFIKSTEGKVRKILAPQPTSYRIGDTFDRDIIVKSTITFNDLVEDYFFRYSNIKQKGSVEMIKQKGYLNIDGIMQR